MDTLHQDDLDVIKREQQYDLHAKKVGLPTSKMFENENLMNRAWNAPGSPFAGQKFDMSKVNFQ